jgi:hypothetical protein
MNQAVQEPRHDVMRTEENMQQRKRILKIMSNSGVRGANENAHKRAKRIGVNMDVDNAWWDSHMAFIFGPCLRRDNIYQVLPQPILHGMDEGLILKTNAGVLEATILEAHDHFQIKATEVPCSM